MEELCLSLHFDLIYIYKYHCYGIIIEGFSRPHCLAEASYRDLVVDYFEQTIAEREPPKSGQEAADEASEALERLSCVAEERTAFGRSFFVLRLWVGDIMGFAGGLEAKSCDGAGPQLPQGCVGLDSYEGDRYISSSGRAQSRC